MLARKLHLKAGMRVAILHAPRGFSFDAPSGVAVKASLAQDLDVALCFVTSRKVLDVQWPKLLASVTQNGAVWVAYPKKGSGVESDLAGMQGVEIGRGSDWNPVAMISIDDTWSAVRFKFAPGLDTRRQERQSEVLIDAEGTVVVDREARVVTPPVDLQKLLAKNARARAHFDGLSFTHRKEYVVWIVGAKKAETRDARVRKTIEMLAEGKKNPSDR